MPRTWARTQQATPPAPPMAPRPAATRALTPAPAARAPRSPWRGLPLYDGLLVETSRKGCLTRRGFLAKWAVTAAEEPRRALAYALYLG